MSAFWRWVDIDLICKLVLFYILQGILALRHMIWQYRYNLIIRHSYICNIRHSNIIIIYMYFITFLLWKPFNESKFPLFTCFYCIEDNKYLQYHLLYCLAAISLSFGWELPNFSCPCYAVDILSMYWGRTFTFHLNKAGGYDCVIRLILTGSLWSR